MISTGIMILLAISILCVSHFVACDNDHGKYTVSYTAESFPEALNVNRNFVMFYAPWCGHCKNLAPTWDELAKVYNSRDEKPVVISKVDCTIHTKLCAEQEVIGFPTIKLFLVGEHEPLRYTGKRDLESLKTYLSHHLNEQPAETEEVVVKTAEVDRDQDVVVLTDDTFGEHVGSGLHFIKFYAPWCGHCKRLAPIWEELGQSLTDAEVYIDKIDCDANPVTCTKYQVRGYPTLLLFNNGKQVGSYNGGRSLAALSDFVKKEMTKLDVDDSDDDMDDEMGMGEDEADAPTGQVVELTASNYDTFVSTRLVFVKFYAPWCGHCKRLAPVWDDLAMEVSEDAVSIAKVDCTMHKAVCDQHEVRGYPTLKIFRNGKFLADYRQSRSLDNLASFARGHLTDHDEL